MLSRVLRGYGVPAEMCEREIRAIERRFQEEFGISASDRGILCFSPAQVAIAEEATELLKNNFKGTVRAVRAGWPA
jgi:hypothetical protein